MRSKEACAEVVSSASAAALRVETAANKEAREKSALGRAQVVSVACSSAFGTGARSVPASPNDPVNVIQAGNGALAGVKTLARRSAALNTGAVTEYGATA